MKAIEIVCGSCGVTMRLGDDLLHRISGRAGRVTCKRCGYKIGIDARGSSLEVLSGGHKLDLGELELDLDAESGHQSEAIEEAPPSVEEPPQSTEDVLKEMVTHFSEYPLSLHEGDEPRSTEVHLSLAPPIPDELKALRRASQAAQLRSASDHEYADAPVPPMRGDDDSLSPHALGEVEEDGERLHLPENFKSSPMSSNLRDETFQSLYPQPRRLEQKNERAESHFARENRARAKHPPEAGQLKRPAMAAAVSESIETLAPAKSSNWGPWALAAAACIGLAVNVVTGPLPSGLSIKELFGMKTEDNNQTVPSAAHEERSSLVQENQVPVRSIMTETDIQPGASTQNWVELLPVDQPPLPALTTPTKKHVEDGEVSGELLSAEVAPEPVIEEVNVPFSTSAAAQAIRQASALASRCRQSDDPSGVAVMNITFSSSGAVTSATVSGPPFAGTPTGSCIAEQFRKARVPAFSGKRVTMNKTVTIN